MEREGEIGRGSERPRETWRDTEKKYREAGRTWRDSTRQEEAWGERERERDRQRERETETGKVRERKGREEGK